jgi:branched-chain amino acid transport system permease protein
MMAAGFDKIVNATGFPNGGSGFLGYQPSGELQRMDRPSIAQSDAAYFRLVLVVAVFSFVLVWLHEKTKPGRAWHLIGQSEGAAHASGINVVLYKTWGFVLAAFLSGIAGALFAGQLRQLGPSSFETIDSLILFALVLVGGAHHWSGWVIGAMLAKAFPAFLDDRGLSGDIATVIAGAALMLNLIGAPRGIAGEIRRSGEVLRARFRKQPDQ